MAELLVSVRSAEEAEAALRGGAGLIDVKEPTRGPLGRADAEVIDAVLQTVAGRKPVSAAMGELAEGSESVPGVSFVKWGLARCSDWIRALKTAACRLAYCNPACRPVAVAYADWHALNAPPPREVCAFACDESWPVFMIDTGEKNGKTLLDWLSLAEIGRLCRQCRQAGVRAALAGSLRVEQIRLLRRFEPDWFAVRGAVCHGGTRDLAVDGERVRKLVANLGERQRVQ